MTVINIPPATDVFVESRYPDSNYGTSTQLEMNNYRYGFFWVDYFETLMRFNIMSYLPPNSIINSAKLYLYATYPYTTSSHKIYNIPTANRTWTLTGVTWNNKPARDNSYPLKVIPAVSTSNWAITDITSYVIDMYNQGIAVEFDADGDGSGTTDTYNSSRASSNKPYLMVDYSPMVSATNITATPTSCTAPCTTVVQVTWKNNSSISQTFTPGITVDGTLHTLSAVTIGAGVSTTKSFNVANLMAGSHVICPVPN